VVLASGEHAITLTENSFIKWAVGYFDNIHKRDFMFEKVIM
jgi:hypothetical protein